MVLTVTLIRHGESEDNTRYIWAGWRDAPLTALGQQQAAAAGKYFATTRFSAIYASPLLRAHQTAEAVRDGSQHPPLTIIKNPNLREQCFGIAEGNPWEASVSKDYSSLEDAYAKGIFPIIPNRDGKFPKGESLDDLHQRGREAIRECILPHLKNEVDNEHILLASHGLAISELVSALVKMDPEAEVAVDYRGLLNTAWARITVSLKDPSSKDFDPSNPPPLNVKVTDFNVSKHLADVKKVPTNAKEAFFAGNTDAAEAISEEKL